MMHVFKRSLLAAALSVGGASLVPAQAASCADVLSSTSDLSHFAELVELSGLAPQLTSDKLTVFAPTNQALGHIATVTQMLAGGGGRGGGGPESSMLQTLVRAHLVSGVHPEDQMHGQVTLTTLAGTTLSINGTDQRNIMLSASAPSSVNLSGMHLMPGVHVSGPAITCDNGVVYAIDNALVQ